MPIHSLKHPKLSEGAKWCSVQNTALCQSGYFVCGGFHMESRVILSLKFTSASGNINLWIQWKHAENIDIARKVERLWHRSHLAAHPIWTRISTVYPRCVWVLRYMAAWWYSIQRKSTVRFLLNAPLLWTLSIWPASNLKCLLYALIIKGPTCTFCPCLIYDRIKSYFPISIRLFAPIYLCSSDRCWNKIWLDG